MSDYDYLLCGVFFLGLITATVRFLASIGLLGRLDYGPEEEDDE